MYKIDLALNNLKWFNAIKPYQTKPPNECPVYDTKKSDSKASVMLELLEMWSTPLLPSLPGPLWTGVKAPDKLLSMGQIELKYILMLKWIT